MDWETEKDIYVRKLQKIIDGIQKINKLPGNSIITAEMSKKIEKCSKEAEKLLPKLQKEIFEIAVVGLEKAGKSSFSNAFIGIDILPTADKRCTYTSTCIKSGDIENAEITFYTKSEFEKDFSEKIAKLTIPNAESYTYRTLTPDNYQRLYENVSDEIKKNYEDTLNQDIRDILEYRDELTKYIGASPKSFSANEKDELRLFITEPRRAIAVKNVTIFSPKLHEMSKAVIYDVPGFDSPTSLHRQQTLERMKEADAIIMVASAKNPNITAPALSIFKENSDTYGCPFNEKLFVFANKADLVATKEKLEENKQDLYNDWMKKRKILSERFKDRIVFGSANAHLRDKVDEGNDALEKLNSLGIESGIENFRTILQEYYKNERFEIVKKRVNTILNDVVSVFSETQNELDESFLSYTGKDLLDIAFDTLRTLEKSWTTHLETIKFDIIHEGDEKPLKSEICGKITDLITLENYGITQKEISDLDKQNSTISGSERPDLVSGKIREKRFTEKHPEFIDAVLGCAVEKHQQIVEKILDGFMDSISLSRGCQEYEKLRERIAHFCTLDQQEDKNYYQSLIDRFSRDLFEVHIYLKPGKDRLNKFKKELFLFLSLGIFYNRDKKSTDSLTDIVHSRSWQLVLYPELAKDTDDDDDLIFEQCMSKLPQIGTEFGSAVPEMIKNIIKWKGNVAVAAVETAFKGFIKDSSPVNSLREITNRLSPLLPSEKQERNLDDILKSNAYLEYIKEHEKNYLDENGNYTYEQVIEDFNADVLALREGLLKSVVHAIDLDKAFVAKDSALIEKIIKIIQSDDFTNFIRDNIELIKHEEMDRLEHNQEQKNVDRAIMKEIQAILQELSRADQ